MLSCCPKQQLHFSQAMRIDAPKQRMDIDVANNCNQHTNIARMYKTSARSHLVALVYFGGRNVPAVNRCFELPANQEKAVTSVLPSLLFTYSYLRE